MQVFMVCLVLAHWGTFGYGASSQSHYAADKCQELHSSSTLFLHQSSKSYVWPCQGAIALPLNHLDGSLKRDITPKNTIAATWQNYWIICGQKGRLFGCNVVWHCISNFSAIHNKCKVTDLQLLRQTTAPLSYWGRGLKMTINPKILL